MWPSDAAQQHVALCRIGRAFQGLPLGVRGLIQSAEIAEQLCAGGVEQVVVNELGGEPVSAALLGDGLEGRREQLRGALPIRRVVGPADVAALAVHVMAKNALTGATFDIDGGQHLL
jgi:hypothetical protein